MKKMEADLKAQQAQLEHERQTNKKLKETQSQQIDLEKLQRSLDLPNSARGTPLDHHHQTQ